MRRFVPVLVPVLVLVGAAPIALASGAQAHRADGKSSHAGQIQFGEGLKRNKIVHPKTQIAKNKSMAWIAHFAHKAGKTKVTIKVIQIGGPGPHPSPKWSTTVSVSKSSMTAKGTLTPKQLNKRHIKANGAKYMLEYLAGSKTLSKGNFQRLSCANCGGGSTGGY